MSKKTMSIVLAAAVVIAVGAGLFANYRFPKEVKDENAVILGQYKDLDSGITKVETADEEIQETIDDVIESRGGIYKEAPDGTISKKGDKLHISYYNQADGADLSTEGDIIIGDEAWPAEFSKTLEGVERSFATDITVTENDEKTVYHVEVISISNEGELDDEYVKGMGLEGIETVEQMKADIKKYLDDAHEEDYKTQLRDYLESTVTESSTVPVIPQDLLDSYKDLINKKIDNMVEYQKAQGDEEADRVKFIESAMKSDEFIGSADEYISWYANSQAKTYLVMKKIAELENIETDQDKLYSAIADDWLSSGEYDSLYDYIKDNDKESYERQLLVDTVLEFLIENNK